MCKECNIKFIGPDYTSIELMGNKAKAREVMKKAKVPVVPGFEGVIKDEKHALSIAKEIGYPVMIKASAGGGGKGIRIAFNDEEFKNGYNTAKAEAKACFGDDTLYIEKYVQKPKHHRISNFSRFLWKCYSSWGKRMFSSKKKSKGIRRSTINIFNRRIKRRDG